MIRALFVLYNKDAIMDTRERDFAFVDAMRKLHEKYPNDPDIGAMFAAGFMNTTRWDYWEKDGTARRAPKRRNLRSRRRCAPNTIIRVQITSIFT